MVNSPASILRRVVFFFGLALSLSANAQQKANPQVVFETSKGSFTVELFADSAPSTVANFLQYAEDDFYQGTIFHRVIPGFVIQGGGFTPELAKKKTRKPIKNEANEENKNLTGTIAMARTSAPDTATSQFFINLTDNPSLDYRSFNKGYAVFGEIIDGMGVVEQISLVDTGMVGRLKDVPEQTIEIRSIKRIDLAPASPEKTEAEE
ncbi:Peptidyl-prolyl cis-trans isomerase B [BD1-7 clade bacterium]|uniref:Peptidyl-prolyl cis-trans isomerase n=1 Tax=BD1-7 clade bacterium TaxID=2029982 RepID=A0A5S9QME4_9GAMM|nr:Peptidyl-prolyl cis-trans isomerase B [BD1-7 clade bacterium]